MPFRTSSLSAPDAALSASGVVASRPGIDGPVTVLHDVSAAFEPGSFTAIIGPAAAGKTYLLNLLAGLARPDEGTTSVLGHALQGLDEAESSRLRREHVRYAYQEPTLEPGISVRDNILLPARLAGREPDASHFDAVVHHLCLDDVLALPPAALSQGQRQAANLARALVEHASIILVDEPSAGLGPRVKSAMLTLLQRTAKDHGSTVVLATVTPLVAAHADRTLILDEGRNSGELQRPRIEQIEAALGQLERQEADAAQARQRRAAAGDLP